MMTVKEIKKRLKLIESVLMGVIPSGNYSGQRRKKQYMRIDAAIIATQELCASLQEK